MADTGGCIVNISSTLVQTGRVNDAAFCVYLAPDKARNITGIALNVDSGQLAR